MCDSHHVAPIEKIQADPGEATADGTSPAATVRELILSGRGGAGPGATWDGTGITSSTAAAANQQKPESRSIGYAENAALPLGALNTFHGVPVDETSILIAYTRTGDANLDGVVNDDDVTIVGAFYAPGVPNARWSHGDFDYNGFVDDDDVTLLGVFYNPAAPSLDGLQQATAAAAVPEPATLALGGGALLVALALGRRFRWRYPQVATRPSRPHGHRRSLTNKTTSFQ